MSLAALTGQAQHLNGNPYAIDHLTVGRELVCDRPVVEVHRPTQDGGQLSDHAAYTASICMPATD